MSLNEVLELEHDAGAALVGHRPGRLGGAGGVDRLLKRGGGTEVDLGSTSPCDGFHTSPRRVPSATRLPLMKCSMLRMGTEAFAPLLEGRSQSPMKALASGRAARILAFSQRILCGLTTGRQFFEAQPEIFIFHMVGKLPSSASTMKPWLASTHSAPVDGVGPSTFKSKRTVSRPRCLSGPGAAGRGACRGRGRCSSDAAAR